MKRRLFAPIILASLFLAGCNIPKFNPSQTSSVPSNQENEVLIESVTLSKEALKLKPGRSSTLTVKVEGKGNIDTSVTWASSNEAAATVKDGVVTVPETAAPNATTVITATSTKNTSKSASCTVTVRDPAAIDKYSLFMYVCGSTLEYGPSQSGYGNTLYGAASEDIDEMRRTTGKPDDVNIVIETGGAERWKNSQIPNNKLGRFTIQNNQLVAGEHVADANMGSATTLQSFLEWGMDEYPAEKYGLVLWNHGGAVVGVCSDENHSGDMLKTSEVASALKGALNTAGESKFEWVGYDACIMNYADNISVIADYANYMVAAQELENGDGWKYDDWLPTLYANPSVSTVTLLDKICKTFVSQYGSGSDNDQTLSAIDLSKAGAFVSAFNTYADHFSTSSDYNKIKQAFSSSTLTFGEDYYGLADMKCFLTQMNSKFPSYSTTDVENALNAMVVANEYGNKYGSTKPCGTNVFVAESLSWYPLQCQKTDYDADSTKFTSWRTINITYGDFYTGSSY